MIQPLLGCLGLILKNMHTECSLGIDSNINNCFKTDLHSHLVWVYPLQLLREF